MRKFWTHLPGPVCIVAAVTMFLVGAYRGSTLAQESNVYNQQCCTSATVITPGSSGLGGCSVRGGVCASTDGACYGIQSASIAPGSCSASEDPQATCYAGVTQILTVPEYRVNCTLDVNNCICEGLDYGSTSILVPDGCAGTPCN